MEKAKNESKEVENTSSNLWGEFCISMEHNKNESKEGTLFFFKKTNVFQAILQIFFAYTNISKNSCVNAIL